jgi:Tol biopolymer transport system component
MTARARTGTLPVLFRWCVTIAAMAVVVPASAARGQFVVRSWLPWRTIETAHFAFHYPVALEAWTQSIAAHVEAIDSAVARVVGYAPGRRTHVVVDDPYAISNGSAWPFLNRPVISLWATPPDPRDDIGEYRDWGEMLVSHEFTHIAHLTRPSRNALMRRLWESLPVDVGPIALRSPRWAIEGYATYVEGRVTGSGRPHGTWRPAMLRQWALEGQLPRYDQLNASGTYAGGEFAYLAGSAFLEWLVQRRGDSSLVAVWRRLSARQNRTFDDAFTGVFGESPRAMYGRFTAELTGRSLAAERAIRASGARDTGEIVQRLAWSTGDPAISRDGQRIALVQRSPTLPSRVVVWSTGPEPDTSRTRRDSVLLARDPEDVPSRTIYPPPKKPLATLRATGGAPYESPRFLRDGRILLWRNASRGDGSLVPDLYIWDYRRRTVRRVTHDASVQDADPSPDARSAVATRCRGGWCDLVAIDLTNGDVTVLSRGRQDESFYRPRVSPDGQRVAVGVHTRDGWRVVIHALHSASRPGPATTVANGYDVSWANPSTLVLVSEDGGIANIERIDLATQVLTSLTHVTGAAVAPETNPADSSVWFLSLYSRGYDVRRVAPPSRTPAVVTLDRELAPAVPIAPVDQARFTTNSVSAPRPFGLGTRLFRWIPQPELDADGASAALALFSGDVIGRSTLLATIATGDRATWRGGALNFSWRGSRPGVRLQLFDAAQQLSASRTHVSIPVALDSRIAGGELALDGSRSFDTWSSRYRLGGTVSRIHLDIPSSADVPASTSRRDIGFGDGVLTLAQRGDHSTVTESIGANVAVGRSSGRSFTRSVTSVSVASSGAAVLPVVATASYGRTGSNAPLFEQLSLGGMTSPLIDRALLGQRFPMPVLPSGISINTSAFAYRIALHTRPLALYFYGGSTAPAGQRFSLWNRVIGADWSAAVPAIAVAGTPAARAELGVGESLDAPFRKRVRAYVSFILDP